MAHASHTALSVLIMSVGLSVHAQSIIPVFTVTDQHPVIDAKRAPAAIGAVGVRVDIRQLNSISSVSIPLPGGEKIYVSKKRVEVKNKRHTVWYGQIAKDNGSLVVLSITPSAIAGRIMTGTGRIFGIHCIEKNDYQVIEFASRKFNESTKDMKPVPLPIDQTGIAPDCPDPAGNIDVMIVYTNDAEIGAGGPDAMEAFIYSCIDLANLSYLNSNISQRLNLVHFAKINYTETGSAENDLDNLQNHTDGIIDNVHTLRDTYAADLVTLIVESCDYCGMGYLPFTVTTANAPYGFSVVKRSCAVDNLSYPHELGHNMGARHDCAADPVIGSPYDYDHGHFVSFPADESGLSWRTVMSYDDCTNGPCNRIPFFSNPSLNYSPTSSTATDPLGSPASTNECTADNHLTLNNTAASVSNYRCSSPGVGNVWMRDTWDDTGLEPDPATAGQDMWKSPYIWVRNDRDAAFEHQFIHENPIYGQCNWAYVKLINGGAVPANGHLELYYAHASVSLVWPGGWTLIGAPTVAIDANSTTIVEIPWDSLPGTGHYCLVARWVSPDDTMTFTETSDIGYNVRQNNNIVWRNVNIVDFPAGSDHMKVEFMMQYRGGISTGIEFYDQAVFPKHAFIESGKIYAVLEKDVFAGWVRAGAVGRGIKVIENKIQLLSARGSIDKIPLPQRKKTSVILVFNRQTTTIADKYDFNVRQYVVLRNDKKELVSDKIGGVGYIINVGK